jgi:hypothetical protein
MSNTIYTKKDADGFLRLDPDLNGFYAYLILDNENSRLLLSEGNGGKQSVVQFTKQPK